MVEEESLFLFYVFRQPTSPQYLNAFKWSGELSAVFNISRVWFLLLSSHKKDDLCVKKYFTSHALASMLP